MMPVAVLDAGARGVVQCQAVRRAIPGGVDIGIVQLESGVGLAVGSLDQRDGLLFGGIVARLAEDRMPVRVPFRLDEALDREGLEVELAVGIVHAERGTVLIVGPLAVLALVGIFPVDRQAERLGIRLQTAIDAVLHVPAGLESVRRPGSDRRMVSVVPVDLSEELVRGAGRIGERGGVHDHAILGVIRHGVVDERLRLCRERRAANRRGDGEPSNGCPIGLSIKRSICHGRLVHFD